VGSDEGTWSDIAQFEVHSNEVEHTFTLVGDPQLGPSGNLQSDGAVGSVFLMPTMMICLTLIVSVHWPTPVPASCGP